MFKIGCHLSSVGGFQAMGEKALELGANTFAYFTRNPRGGKAKAIDPRDVEGYHALAREEDLQTLVAHAPYTLNPCSAKEHLRVFAREMFQDDLLRMETMPGNYYNFHPGSHTGQGPAPAIDQIVEMLNASLKPSQRTTVLLETMAGKGTEMGGNFQELRAIIDGVELKDKMGICMDSCHLWDGGYDVVNRLDEVLEEFDRIVGLGYLKAMHLNDSKNPLGARKDRHEKIGRGHLGLDAFQRIINHPILRDIPFILETPNEPEGYAEEIKLLQGLRT